MYNRRMKKWAWAVFILVALGAACLVTGFWKFQQYSFVVPVKLSTGEAATIEGKVPSTAWAGENAAVTIRMVFSSPQHAKSGRLNSEIVLPSTEVTPPGQISLAFDPASPVELSWSIKPLSAGKLDGTIWVNASLDGSIPQAVLARSFQIDSRTLLGVSALWIRRIGLGFFLAALFLAAAFLRTPGLSQGETSTHVR
jgi:hypothetical protein